MADEPHSRLSEFRKGLARYTPIARLAAGGMGEVWRGEAHFPDGHVQEVAFKRVLPHLASDPLYRSMIEDEARLGMLLKHPNIVRVYDARNQGSFIIVMEYVAGRSLRDVCERLRTMGSHVPVAAALHIAHGIAGALDHAHRAIDEWGRELSVIHGDVSPHNVLVGHNGAIKLMDFGLARASANSVTRDPERISGKYGYLAPEVVLRRETSQSMDLFALGVVLWECLSGQRLFNVKSYNECRKVMRDCTVPPLRELHGAVPEALADLVTRLLSKNPALRPADAGEVCEELYASMLPLDPVRCQEATATLMALTLGKPRSEIPSVGRRAERLSESELEEFFASMATTTFQRPSPPSNAPQLSAFVEECDTTLMPRLT